MRFGVHAGYSLLPMQHESGYSARTRRFASRAREESSAPIRPSMAEPISRKENTMPRIALVQGKDDVPAEHHALVDRIVGTFGGVVGPSTVLLHRPELAPPVYDIGDYFRGRSLVPAKLRLLGVLVAARERQGEFVWAAQVEAALRAGVAEAIIDLIRQRAAPSRFPVEEGEVIAYAEQLLRTNRVDQATFDALRDRHGTPWLIELTVVIGYYAMLSGVVSAFEVPPPADGDPLPK
jgi:4-carboxymuconolactone decarboxylase